LRLQLLSLHHDSDNPLGFHPLTTWRATREGNQDASRLATRTIRVFMKKTPRQLATSDTHTNSLSFRKNTQRLANAGCDQRTSRPQVELVGSSRWARLISL